MTKKGDSAPESPARGGAHLAVSDPGPGPRLAAVDLQVETPRRAATQGVLDLAGHGRGSDDAHRDVVRGRRVVGAEEQGHEDGRERCVGGDEAGVDPEPGLIPACVIGALAHG
jgi:hypothetical protein